MVMRVLIVTIPKSQSLVQILWGPLIHTQGMGPEGDCSTSYPLQNPRPARGSFTGDRSNGVLLAAGQGTENPLGRLLRSKRPVAYRACE